jgi:hypothetical protein
MFPSLCDVVRLMIVLIPLAIPLEVSFYNNSLFRTCRGTNDSSTNVPHARCSIYDPNSRV